MARKKPDIAGTLDGAQQADETKPKTRAANKVTIELSPKVVGILKDGSAELMVKMPDLLRRLAESPLIAEAAHTLLGNIAAQANEKLQKWLPAPPSRPYPGAPVERDPDGTQGQDEPGPNFQDGE